jgi:hypothetical protein
MMSSDSRKITVSRLYADERGESHFVEERLDTQEVNFAPPAPSMFRSDPVNAAASMFLLLPDGYFGDLHPAPRKQIMTLVRGGLEVTVSDGEVRHFTPGQTVLVDDTTGKGHATRSVGGESVVAVVQL